jgi:DNA-directed RNA polymerase specialized sigma24 family protein
MYGTERIPVTETHRTTTAALSAVYAAESPIRACLAQRDVQTALSRSEELYADLVGRYCMAALGDLELVEQAVVDIWSKTLAELENVDATRTLRSLLLGLARRRCAYLLETSQVRSDVADDSQATVDATSAAQKLPLPQMARLLLSQLRPSEREVLILRYVCHLTYNELGGLWGLGESDAQLKVSQALLHATAIAQDKEARHG